MDADDFGERMQAAIERQARERAPTIDRARLAIINLIEEHGLTGGETYHLLNRLSYQYARDAMVGKTSTAGQN